MPKAALSELRSFEESGRLHIIEGCEVEDAVWTLTQGRVGGGSGASSEPPTPSTIGDGEWTFTLDDKRAVACSAVWLATGGDVDLDEYPLLRRFNEEEARVPAASPSPTRGTICSTAIRHPRGVEAPPSPMLNPRGEARRAAFNAHHDGRTRRQAPRACPPVDAARR